MQETTAHTKVEGKLKQHIFRLSAQQFWTSFIFLKLLQTTKFCLRQFCRSFSRYCLCTAGLEAQKYSPVRYRSYLLHTHCLHQYLISQCCPSLFCILKSFAVLYCWKVKIQLVYLRKAPLSQANGVVFTDGEGNDSRQQTHVRVKSYVTFRQHDWNSRCALSLTRSKMNVNERNISLKSSKSAIVW